MNWSDKNQQCYSRAGTLTPRMRIWVEVWCLFIGHEGVNKFWFMGTLVSESLVQWRACWCMKLASWLELSFFLVASPVRWPRGHATRLMHATKTKAIVKPQWHSAVSPSWNTVCVNALVLTTSRCFVVHLLFSLPQISRVSIWSVWLA